MKQLLLPLSAAFRLGVTLRTAAYRRGWLKIRRLARPVVSVGNLTVGGTGKTPFVAFLGERLRKRGWNPAILTRGYGRPRGSHLVTIEPASARSPDPRVVGDEPALLARILPQAPILVGADRLSAGRVAEEQFDADIHILDDGFQHLALARDMDIVLLDATQEFSGGALLPAGRYREPSSALKRAHIIVITRREVGDAELIEREVRRLNQQARVFHGVTQFRGLRDMRDGKLQSPSEAGGKKALAFCGIGNPRAFFSYLHCWGISVEGEKVFRDHHAYTIGDLTALETDARKLGADFLVTTEKDAINVPFTWSPSLPMKAAIIQASIFELNEFESSLFSRLEAARSRT